MRTAQLYALHGAYGGTRGAGPAPTPTDASALGPDAATAPAHVTRGAASPLLTTATTVTTGHTAGEGVLCSRGPARHARRPMPDDPDLLVTPDAELCTRHRASLVQVREWRVQLAQQHRSLHVLRETSAPASTSTDGGPLARLRRLDTAAEVMRQRTALVPALRGALAVPTGLPTLDAALLGGLRRGWVTELTGLAGAGKTTLAAAWARHAVQHAARGGRRCDCVWLQAGCAVPPAVLSIAFDRAVTCDQDLADAVHVATLGGLEELQETLCGWDVADRAASPLRDVGLIVVDSITDLVRRTFAYRDADALRRHDAVAAVLQALKRLADVGNVAVLVITQQQQQQQQHQPPLPYRTEPALVAPRRLFGRDGADTDEDAGPSRAAAAEDVGQLGRLFFHNVNVRLQLRCGAPVVMQAEVVADDGSAEVSRRLRWQLEVIKSPLCAPFAVALQLCVPPDASPGLNSTDAAAAPLIGPPLGVTERSDGDTAVVPLAAPAGEAEGWLVSCIDPWDHTEVPSFVYV